MAQQVNLLTALRGELDGGPTGLMIVKVAIGSTISLILVAVLSPFIDLPIELPTELPTELPE